MYEYYKALFIEVNEIVYGSIQVNIYKNVKTLSHPNKSPIFFKQLPRKYMLVTPLVTCQDYMTQFYLVVQ